MGLNVNYSKFIINIIGVIFMVIQSEAKDGFGDE